MKGSTSHGEYSLSYQGLRQLFSHDLLGRVQGQVQNGVTCQSPGEVLIVALTILELRNLNFHPDLVHAKDRNPPGPGQEP